MTSYNKFSSYYDELIREDIDYENIRDFVLEKSLNRNYYLDLGCGTGSASCLIGEYFKKTYLVDLSENMLAMASNKFYDKKIDFKAFNISMTDINLIKEKFSLITSTIDSLNYIENDNDLKDIFKSVYDLLEDEGTFIFDLNSSFKLREVLGENTFIYDEEDIFYSWENFIMDDIVHMYLNFFIKKGAQYERFVEEHREKIYTEEFIIKSLKESGFNKIKIYDNYTKKEINNKSERLTFAVRK